MLSKRCFYIKYFLHKKYNALCKYRCIILTMIRTRRRWLFMWHVWGRRGVHTGFLWGNLRERPRCKWKDNIKTDL